MTEQSSRRVGVRGFLTPGWLITVALVASFMWLAFTVLAPWQLGKNEVRTARNERISEAVTKEAVPYLQVVDPTTGVLAQENEWTKVITRGHYLPQDEALLRMQLIADSPTLQALTAFQVENGPIILVNRGFVPAGSASAVPDIPAAPTGDVTIEGYALKAQSATGKEIAVINNVPQPTSINPDEIEGLFGVDLAPDYVQLSDGQPGVINAIPLPRLESGPYLSYGIQWIAFGILAPIGLIYFIFSEAKERRRDQEMLAKQQATTGATSGTGAATAPAASSTTSDTSSAETAEAGAATATTSEAAVSEGTKQPGSRRGRRGARYSTKEHTQLWANDDDERF